MSLTGSGPLDIAQAASISARRIAIVSTQARNDALTAIYIALSDAKDEILRANTRDVRAAEQAAERGVLSQSVLKRLNLSREGKWEEMMKGILDVRDLEDPGEQDRQSQSRC